MRARRKESRSCFVKDYYPWSAQPGRHLKLLPGMGRSCRLPPTPADVEDSEGDKVASASWVMSLHFVRCLWRHDSLRSMVGKTGERYAGRRVFLAQLRPQCPHLLLPGTLLPFQAIPEAFLTTSHFHWDSPTILHSDSSWALCLLRLNSRFYLLPAQKYPWLLTTHKIKATSQHLRPFTICLK